MILWDILKLLIGIVVGACIFIVAIVTILFPEQARWLWDVLNLSWARTSARDIGAATSKMVKTPLLGSWIEGFLVGLIGVWVLLKTGSLEKIREYGGSVGAGTPRLVARLVCLILWAPVTSGVIIIGIVKLNPLWGWKACVGLFQFAVLDRDFDLGELK